MNYEIIESPYGDTSIKRVNSDGTETWIPEDSRNVDYQEYLAWKDAQNGSA